MGPLLLEILVCPRCRSRLQHAPSAGGSGLRCGSCQVSVPVRDGIPRFVQENEAADLVARRTQASFGYEWNHFNDWRPSGETNFGDYFDGLDLAALKDCRVLDAGCGMGRHARFVAPHARHLVAVDFSRAIDQASRNTMVCGNIDCVQADVTALPFEDGTFDYAYSLGVLHHLSDTRAALAGLVRKVRPGGRVRIYLYWKRHGWPGALLRIVSLARRITTRMPFPLLRTLCWLLSAALFAGVVLPYRLLLALGVRAHRSWPLFVYTKYPFRVLYNDQFDRFSAPIERRFDEHEVRDLMESVGLRDVAVRARFGWIAEGMR